MAKHGVTEFLTVFQSDGSIFFDPETDILIKMDGGGNILRVNPAFEKTLGYSENEVIGKSLIEIVSMRDLGSIDPKAFRFLRKGGGEVLVKVEDWRYRKPFHYAIFRRIKCAIRFHITSAGRRAGAMDLANGCHDWRRRAARRLLYTAAM